VALKLWNFGFEMLFQRSFKKKYKIHKLGGRQKPYWFHRRRTLQMLILLNCICRVLGTQGEPRMSAMCASVAFRTSFKKNYRQSGWLCTRWGEIAQSLNFKYLYKSHCKSCEPLWVLYNGISIKSSQQFVGFAVTLVKIFKV
jgi:hypothetical protein